LQRIKRFRVRDQWRVLANTGMDFGFCAGRFLGNLNGIEDCTVESVSQSVRVCLGFNNFLHCRCVYMSLCNLFRDNRHRFMMRDLKDDFRGSLQLYFTFCLKY
jgi:hypothetical protein